MPIARLSRRRPLMLMLLMRALSMLSLDRQVGSRFDRVSGEVLAVLGGISMNDDDDNARLPVQPNSVQPWGLDCI